MIVQCFILSLRLFVAVQTSLNLSFLCRVKGQQEERRTEEAETVGVYLCT